VSGQSGLRSFDALTTTHLTTTRVVTRRLGPAAVATLVAAAATTTATPRAHADPQASLGTTIGGAITELRTSKGPSGAFHLGGRGDVILLRKRESDMGLGPYLDVATEGFETLELGGGLEWLLPIVPSVPLVVGAGLLERRAPMLGWQPGLAANLFFGPRGYNFHSWYGMANGVFVEGRYGLGDGKQGDIVFGLRLDVVLLALPWLFGWEALTH
jgi:hypothetical protein